jgi:hypothetical protein
MSLDLTSGVIARIFRKIWSNEILSDATITTWRFKSTTILVEIESYQLDNKLELTRKRISFAMSEIVSLFENPKSSKTTTDVPIIE